MRNWDDLQTILALGRAGTMKGAAAALSVSETTISRRIQKIAEGDDDALFDRNGHKWSPTPLGRHLISVAERVEAEIIAAETKLESDSHHLSGILKVSSLSFLNSHFITPHLASFHAAHPELTIVLDASDEIVSLAYRQADIALRLARPSEGRLITKRLCALPIAPFAPIGATPDNWIGLTENLDWTPEMKGAIAHYRRPPRLRLDGFDGIMRAAQVTGLGGLAPTCLIRRHPQFVRSGPVFNREIWLTYHEDMRNSVRVRAGAAWLSTAFGGAQDCLCGECRPMPD